MQHVSLPWDKSNQTTCWCTTTCAIYLPRQNLYCVSCKQAAMTLLPLTNKDRKTASGNLFYSFISSFLSSLHVFVPFFLSPFFCSVLLLIPTCSHSPGAPGCTGAAPCPGARGGPAACAVRRVTRGPGLGWSDAGGTDLHPWVPHTGDSTLSHQHTANQQHQAEPRTRRDEAKSRVAKRGVERCYRAKRQRGETGQDGKETGMEGGGGRRGGEAIAEIQLLQ